MPPETPAENQEQSPRPNHGDAAPNDSLKNPTSEEVIEEIVEPPPASETTFKLGSKVFSSPEEASKYVAALEEKKLQEVTLPAPAAIIPTGMQKEMIDGKPIDEVLFENPTKVVQHIANKAAQAARDEKAKGDRRAELWAKFYARNPDLRGKERILNSIIGENVKEWDKLSEEDAMKMLAKTARDEIRSMGLEPGKVTDLPPANPATLRGSGSGTGAAPGSAPKKSTSFTDEILAMRAKRAGAAKH